MLYLFYGSDEFSASEQVVALREQIPADVRALNTVTFDGRKLKLDDLVQACEALPFLAERRVVVVTDALKHLKAGKAREELRDYLKQAPIPCELIFWERGDVDKRNAVFLYLKKQAELREFQPRQGSDLLRWVGERAKLLGAKLDRPSAQHLVNLVGNDSRTLVNELAKLATYVGRGGKITAPAIDTLVQDNREQSLFAFIDTLANRQAESALRGLRGLLADGQAPAYILFMLMRQVRILLGVQELQAQQLAANDIATQLKQKPFVVRKALEQTQGFARADLEHLHDRLIATDQAIKTGRMKPEVALELLVYEWMWPDWQVQT